ncbi:hypothetical protein [Streptomyces sp. SAI-041]|uniref:hypothetical protein n=1 Tax=Streptomyces sp. SAI-041 TaxID=2940548 RepID=UPI002475D5B6|nr:hypothetical protein [Streptomyces sp. SAI-041]MDH6553993.1 hypothetical protein [Streptomyces sp. SAI-041]
MTDLSPRRRAGIRSLPISELRKEHGPVLNLLKCVLRTRWWITAGVCALTTGISLVFAVFDEDRLRMSDDYAAMTSAALALLLTLGFLEMERSVRKAQGMADAQLAAVESGVPLPETQTVLAPETRAGVRLGVAVLLVWLTGTVLMVSALVLIFLWAAIEGHGPARWLAWYVLISTCLGLGGLLAATVTKTTADLETLKRTYLSSLSRHVTRGESPRDVDE